MISFFVFFCEHCKYKSKKENVLQKHKNYKHAITHKRHQCNQCRKRFPSLSDLLEHDEIEHRAKEVQNNTSFVFSETILDEFGVWESLGMVTADELVLVQVGLRDTLASG